MRHVVVGVGLTALLAVGCNQWSFMRQNNPAPGLRVASATPTAQELVASLNENAHRVTALECRDVDIDCRQRFQQFNLSAKVFCQKPHNFRMVASALGSTVVDMGSNDQEFWWWISKAEPPYLFHCSYQEFAQGRARMPFPFQPEWIMEAMGAGEYDPGKQYEVRNTKNGLELIERGVSAQGQPVQKVTVLVRNRANQFQVTAHSLRDANGKEVCSAYVSELQQDASGAILPHRVQLVWPAEQIQMKMRLEGSVVNPQLPPDRTLALFTRPQLKDVPSYDLAAGGLDSGGPAPYRRAGGVQRGYSR